MQMPFHPQHSFAVQSLLEYLEKEYYTPAGKSCERILQSSGEQDKSLKDNGAGFGALACALATHMQRYIRVRRLSLVPYLAELVEKEDTGHDCRACSSSCTIRHSAQLKDITDAHARIRASLHLLKTAPASPALVSSPLFSETQILTELLSELLYLEETALVPKISAAQQAIHAHD